MDFSNKYVIGFTLAICLVASGAVATIAEVLRDRIDKNQILDQQRQVIRVAGLAAADDPLPEDRVAELFKSVEGKVIDRKSGDVIAELSVEDIDPLKMAKDPNASEATPAEFKLAQVARLPEQLEVFVVNSGETQSIVLPIHGKGLWSTMYGYLAVEKADAGLKVKGITFYAHGETPGLGGEIDNKKWQSGWADLSVYGDDGSVQLGVVKSGAQRDENFQVDGLAGATITSKGVDATVKLWLGSAGYGPYLAKN